MIKRYIYAIALLTAICGHAQQLQNANWYFGYNAGLSFVPNPQNPTSISTGLSNLEGTASYSNTSGQLQFYTNGREIFTNNHVLMTNGSGLKGHTSSTQGVHIIKSPVNSNAIIGGETLYVVTIDGYTGTKQGLYYSVVNLNASGTSEVVAATKNTVLRDHNNTPIGLNYATEGNMSEKMTSTPHCDGINYWLVTQIGGNIYSYLVTSTGISPTPTMVSPAPINVQTNKGAAGGQLKISPNNERIAICYHNSGFYTGDIAMGYFDSSTGTVTFDANLINIPPTITEDTDFIIQTKPFGIEFSPNNEFVYFGITDKVYKGDAYFSTSQNVAPITPTSGTGLEYKCGFQLAINGKIYVANADELNNFTISVINNPDNDIEPDFKENSVTLAYGSAGLSFPGWVHSQVNKCPPSYVLASPDTHTLPHTYQTKNFIVTTSNYRVDAGKNITLRAGNYIEMAPNTSIVSGSVFLAEIVECISCPVSTITSQQGENGFRTTEDVAQVKLILYPNPANEYVNLTIPNQVLKQVTVISLDGTTMLNSNINANFKLDVSNYKKGIYFVTVTTESGDTFTEKLMVN